MRLLTLVSLLASTVCFAAAYDSRTQGAPLNKFPFPADHPFLKIATDENFRSLLVESSAPTVAAFYKTDDGVSRSVAKNLELVALALRPLIDVVVMDGELAGAKDLLSTYGITNLPVILHFNSDLHPIPGADNQWAKLPEGYQGDGSAGGLVRWALQKLSHTTVERVSDDHSLANFLSIHDHLHYPKVLLVTKDPSNATAPLFLSLAQRMRSAAVFGVSHNCQAIIDKYQITEFPAVLGFSPEGGLGDFTLVRMPPLPSAGMIVEQQARDAAAKAAEAEAKAKAAADGTAPQQSEEEAKAEQQRQRDEARAERRNERLRKRGVEGGDAAGKKGAAAVDPNAPNYLYGDVEYEEAAADLAHMVAWINTFGIPEAKRREYGMLIANEEEKFRDRAKEMAKWASALEPMLVRDRAAWERSCLKMKQRGVCIVVFRDMSEFEGSDEEVAERVNLEMYREIARKAATKAPNTPLQIVVADGTTNHALVSALGISNGVPDMVALWPAKKKFYNFLGAVNERNILNLFLDRAIKDKNAKALPADLPSFLKTGSSAEDEAAAPPAAAPTASDDSDESNVIGAGVGGHGDEDDSDL